ncbi:MAG: hypothetical protein M9962_09715 [Oligoflexia bacterium]|nr:hypothetical protein [Oligoflexia bacterium]
MSKLFLFLVLFCCASNGYASDPRPEMHALAEEITILQKYLFTENSFTALDSRQKVKNSLGAIRGHLESLKRSDIKDDVAMSINLEMLKQHIQDTSRAVDKGDFLYVKNMVKSSFQMCINCHTRKSTPDFSWPESDMTKMKEIERADYYFATRQFSKGKSIYEDLIESYPKTSSNISDIRNSLLEMAIYFAKVQEDPKEGAVFFTRVTKNKELPVYLVKESDNWAKEFLVWSKESKSKKDLKPKELLSKGKKLLEGDQFTLVSELGRSFHIRRLRASVLFHKILEDKSATQQQKGEALYYLGKIYSITSSNLFFRFGELYLKACIQENKKTEIAQKCYVSLESIVIDGYSGSAGTSVPEDEKNELSRLKTMAF